MLVHVHTHTCTHLHMRSHVCTRMHDIVHMCTYMCVLQRHLGCLPPGVALQWPVQRPRDGLCPLPRASRGHRSHGCGRSPRDARGTYHHVVDVVRFLEGHFLAFSAFSAFAFCKYNMGVHASRPQCLTTNTRFRRHGGRTAPDSQQPRLQGPGWSKVQGPGGEAGGEGDGAGGGVGLEDHVGVEAGGEMSGHGGGGSHMGGGPLPSREAHVRPGPRDRHTPVGCGGTRASISTGGPFAFAFAIAVDGALGQEVQLLLHPALPAQQRPDHRVVPVDGEDLLVLE